MPGVFGPGPPSFLRGVKSKVDEQEGFFHGSLEAPLGPQKDQETNTFTDNFFALSCVEFEPGDLELNDEI